LSLFGAGGFVYPWAMQKELLAPIPEFSWGKSPVNSSCPHYVPILHSLIAMGRRSVCLSGRSGFFFSAFPAAADGFELGFVQPRAAVRWCLSEEVTAPRAVSFLLPAALDSQR
jgi:hypothetical protein